ncbi:hypothetical protein GV828_12010 [Flavobacterium sp. NST-5]|uniref:Putative auto-transporter adhesin head GIN domain-containing protein n=1 Tax=Flavobacterium ichthyis TaxID=2698827 RepID=A0ABW9ZFQ8_9FLAO|nr:head GIN domain-containing protein [Flavobacterium ichthyis]NBL65925.1 hypothetical protein [Flavobacterium ichthyis]
MIRFIFYTLILITATIATAQVSENRTVGNFSKIKVSQGIELFYTPSATQSIKVETDDNEKLKMIKTEMEGNTLKVFIDANSVQIGSDDKKRKRRNRNWNNNVNFKVLKVWVSAPNVDGFKASSSGSIKVEKPVSANEFSIDASSSGSISGNFSSKVIHVDISSSADANLQVDTEKINIQASSSADADISGKATELYVKASSSADVNADNLQVQNAKIEASSSADVDVFVTENLDAKASSSASVDYKGNPKQVNAEKSSSGSVTKK